MISWTCYCSIVKFQRFAQKLSDEIIVKLNDVMDNGYSEDNFCEYVCHNDNNEFTWMS